MDCSCYSSLTHRLCVTTLVFQFVRGFRQLNLDEPVSPSIQLVAENLQYAELSWVCHIQAKSFVKELEYLRSPGKQPAPTYVQQFGLFLDDNDVMRCKGRINNSTVSLEEKNPIFFLLNIYGLNYLLCMCTNKLNAGGEYHNDDVA